MWNSLDRALMKPKLNPKTLFRKAARISRETASANGGLAKILQAEERIGEIAAAGQSGLPDMISSRPNDGFLRLWNGLGLSRQGRPSEACQEFLAAGDLGCNHWRVGWYLAQAASQAGDRELAQAACEAVLRANPDFQPAGDLLAGQVAQAADAPISVAVGPIDSSLWSPPPTVTQQATGLDLTGFLEGAMLDALVMRAVREFARDYLQSAQAAVSQALVEAPDDSPLIAALGNIHFHLGDFPAARREFEQAVRRDPFNPTRHVQLAAACLKLKDVAAFESALTQAMTLYPNCVPALRLLAKTHFEFGNYPASAKLYERILALQPGDGDAGEALDACRFGFERALKGDLANVVAGDDAPEMAAAGERSPLPSAFDAPRFAQGDSSCA